MKRLCYYDRATGLFEGTVVLLDGAAPPTMPAHLEALDSHAADPLSQRVDLTTGDLVDYQPPAPDEDHAWNEKTRRYELTGEAIARRQADAAAKVTISQGELASLRAMRELLTSPRVRALLTDPSDVQNLERLDEIDAAIAGARPALQTSAQKADPEEEASPDGVLAR